jgi:hypothetical protein
MSAASVAQLLNQYNQAVGPIKRAEAREREMQAQAQHDRATAPVELVQAAGSVAR